ncbi:MAG: hypothetical protein JKY93_12505 [Gammaproteobacteria bacterium]|nr:hypothetical protein [Gammaproteobacteria bacterium]
MGTVIPDHILASPQFYYPNRKPIGPVEIDWSHPLARGLKFCWMPLNGNEFDLVADVRPDNDTLSISVEPYKGVYASVFEGNAIVENGRYLLEAPVPNQGQTVLAIANFSADAVDTAIFTISSITAAGWRTLLWRDEFASGDRLAYAINDGSTAIAYGATTLTTDRWYPLVGRTSSDGAVSDVFVDGKLDGTVDSSAITPSQADSVFIGNRAGQYSQGMQGGLALSLIYDRALSDAEVLTLSRNPYQILVPK